jgi:hypothetical protein
MYHNGCANFRYCCSTCIKGLKKTTKNLSWDRRNLTYPFNDLCLFAYMNARETMPLEIPSIYLGNKEIYFNLKACYTMFYFPQNSVYFIISFCVQVILAFFYEPCNKI